MIRARVAGQPHPAGQPAPVNENYLAQVNKLENIPAIRAKLETLTDVGMGYIKLGQQATTLSGGEAQRVKLSRELSKRSTGQTVYIPPGAVQRIENRGAGDLVFLCIVDPGWTPECEEVLETPPEGRR